MGLTIYDIAKQAGVSASTVSRVINRHSGIKKSTREKVEKILAESNFSVSEAARGLVNQTSRMIGILVSDIRNQHHIEGAYMMEQHFMKKGYCSIILNAGDSDESKAGYVRILASRRVDALVLVGSAFQCEAVRQAIEDYMPDTPVVFQNGVFSLKNVSSAVADEVSGTYEAVKYLYNQGRRHIAYINNNDTPSNRKKIAGYDKAMEELGLVRSFHVCEDSAEGSADATTRLLDQEPETDAIIYSVDILAVGASRRILDMGKHIPQDIAIIGTDNSPIAGHSNPRLSSIDTRLQELSTACSQILEKAIEDPSYHEEVEVTPVLVLRETT